MKNVELVCVGTEINNNKYYRMQENADGTFTARWGRVGGHESSKVYPMKDWDKTYRKKTTERDGYIYKDVTALRADVKTVQYKELTNPIISKLLSTLQSYSKQSIVDNYTVSSESVTKAQVDRAQEVLNQVTDLIQNKRSATAQVINELFRELYITIPRKMKKVQDFLLSELDLTRAREIIDNEQQVLDVMAQQVSTASNASTEGETSTLEDALGIKIEIIKDSKEIDEIRTLMGADVSKYRNAYRITNKSTQRVFEDQLGKSFKPWKKLLWHGSRNENWLNILQTGLVLRPTNAIITGKMFGYGIYFADKCSKSMGYTSLSGSYWARGNSRQGFMALFDANTGMELRVDRHESWMPSLTYDSFSKKGQYDSLFAKGGSDLRNNEFIVYKQNQCTVKYLVEIGA
jgi:poly [ADP-ribose] polymerase